MISDDSTQAVLEAEGPPLPTMQEAVLDAETVGRLFADLASCTRVLDVHVKGRATHHSTAGRANLADVQRRLRAGLVAAAQVRYLYDGFEWTDTLLSTPAGVKLVRCRHEEG